MVRTISGVDNYVGVVYAIRVVNDQVNQMTQSPFMATRCKIKIVRH